MKRSHAIWIPIGFAIALAVLALVTMFGGLNGPIRSAIEERLASALDAEVSIEALDGNPLFEFSLSRVEILRNEGTTFRCGEAVVSYRPVSLLWGNVVIDTVRLVSPRVEWRHRPGETEAGPAFDRTALPSIDLKSIVVEGGIVALEEGSETRVADDLHFELGFNNTGGEAALEVRRLETLVLDPPVQISNLQGLALSRENMLLFQDVKISSPRSSLMLSGEVVGLSNPLYRFDVTIDSLALAEVTEATGIDLPPATIWLSGRVEGSSQSTDVTFDWVIGGAAGDVKLRLSDVGEQEHRIEIRGREADLTTLAGVSVRGDFVLHAEGKGLDLGSASGHARASVSNGSLYGVRVDSVAAEVRYGGESVEGGLLLDGDIGTFYGAIRVDREQRLFVNGRLAGVDLSEAGGPKTRIGGDLRVSRLDRTTRIELDLDQIVAFDRRFGTVDASISQSESRLSLDAFKWIGYDDAFDLRGGGDLWRSEDGLFSLEIDGTVSPELAFDTDSVRDWPSIAFSSRLWSESLAFGATRERISIGADLTGLLGLDSLAVEATADGGRIVLDRFEADGDAASLTVTGETILESAFDLSATYTADTLEELPAGMLDDVEAEDVTVTATVIGPWDDPDILARLVTRQAKVEGAVFQDLSIEANVPVIGDGGVSLQSRLASWGGRDLPGFYADVGSSGQEVSFLIGNSDGSENQVSLWGVATTGDSLAIRVDSVRIQLQEEFLANRGPVILSRTGDSGLIVRQLNLGGPSGQMETVPGDADGPIRVRIRQFDLAPWAFLVGLDGRLEGALNGEISVQHAEGRWSTRTALEVENARVDRFRADALFSDVTYQDERAFGEVGARVGGGRIYFEGVVDLDIDDPDREIDARLVSEAIPLSAFGGVLPQLANIDGEMSGQIWMTGRTSDVELNGNMLASSVQFTVPALNRGLSGVTIELDVSPESLDFDRFDGSGQTGRLSVSGRIDLQPVDFERILDAPLLGPMELELKAQSLDAAATPDVKATIDGTVRLTGTLDRPVLSGNVALQKAEIRLLSMLQTPPDPESIWRTVPFFQNLQTDLVVTSDRQLWVRDEAVNIELSGDLDILRDQNDLIASRSDELGFRFFGTMNSLRGTYRFQNRNFRIYREEGGQGGLRFDGERSGAPAVDIKAWSRFPILAPDEEGAPERQEAVITAKVTGSFEQPEVLLYEGHPDDLDPAEAADEAIQARLLAYILFGRDPDLLIAAEQNLLGSQSTGMLVGLATRELQSRIAQSLNLDLVQVEMSSASEIDRVTVGKYIGDRLFVTYEDQIGQGREFGVEYELFPRFSLESRWQETPDGQVQPSLRFTWGKDW